MRFPLFAVVFFALSPVLTWAYCTMANLRDERVNPHPYGIQLDSVHHELADALDRIEGREIKRAQTLVQTERRDNQ